MELAFLNEKLEHVSNVFITATYWIQLLSNAKQACELYYNEPNELLLPYLVEVNKVIGELKKRQEDCLQYRQLPLEQILGLEGKTPALSPSKYPNTVEEYKQGNGLLGKGMIDFPLFVHGVNVNYKYHGYVTKSNEGVYVAQLHGNLWLNGKIE